jgi:hypothetical protein
MNQTQKLVSRTVDNIGLMHSSLVSLRDEVLPVNPKLFAIMAEGPIDDLRSLLDYYEELVTHPEFSVQDENDSQAGEPQIEETVITALP